MLLSVISITTIVPDQSHVLVSILALWDEPSVSLGLLEYCMI